MAQALFPPGLSILISHHLLRGPTGHHTQLFLVHTFFSQLHLHTLPSPSAQDQTLAPTLPLSTLPQLSRLTVGLMVPDNPKHTHLG